jgi:CubicO group peptidase (beta-lactamase class C family)
MGLGGGGLSATLPDNGPFGLPVVNDGVVNGKGIVPRGRFNGAGSAQGNRGKPVDYGYTWWPLPAGEPIYEDAFEARGIFGQLVYINRREQLVILVLSARPKPTGMSVTLDEAFFGPVIRALR